MFNYIDLVKLGAKQILRVSQPKRISYLTCLYTHTRYLFTWLFGGYLWKLSGSPSKLLFSYASQVSLCTAKAKKEDILYL